MGKGKAQKPKDFVVKAKQEAEDDGGKKQKAVCISEEFHYPNSLPQKDRGRSLFSSG